eukprot:GHVU01123190.1.p3 GENE.GHVU01123190.1~~GHVU01123190.1.p3  ORF type:complete len:124 (+),score=29.50 GHVU01123190.1:941-1312(+)
MVTNRWRIFKQASLLDLPNLLSVIDAAFRLHNFIIECGIEEHGRKGVHEWLKEQDGADVLEASGDGPPGREGDDEESEDECEDDEQLQYLGGGFNARLQQRREGLRLRDDLVALVERVGVQLP